MNENAKMVLTIQRQKKKTIQRKKKKDSPLDFLFLVE